MDLLSVYSWNDFSQNEKIELLQAQIGLLCKELGYSFKKVEEEEEYETFFGGVKKRMVEKLKLIK